MGNNVFDISVGDDGAASQPAEPSYEPPTYLPSTVSHQPLATPVMDDREAPIPPAPPAPPAPPSATLPPPAPDAQRYETVAVTPPPHATPEVSQALLNAPPPQPVAQAGPPVPESYRAVPEPVSLIPWFVDSAQPVPSFLPATSPATSPEPAPVPSSAEPVVQPKTEAPPMSHIPVHETSAPLNSGQPPADFPPPQVATPMTPPAFESRRDPNLNPDPDLDEALQKVLMTSGSDLHVTADSPPMIRVDGSLKPIAGAATWTNEKVASALRSIMTPSQQEKFDEVLEYDFAYTLSANARFRVNFYQQRGNMGAAFRLIPTEIKALRDLGVPEVIGNFAKLARGLVLVTGPTGSGKSTTLAGLIDLVNRTRADHIMTVEDPIEFLHQNHKSLVNQREVGQDTHSFAAALKHVLRQDPDVILVGELRDLETISVALTAAETGHLVFATLHTQSAPQTIDRIIDVYPPHQQGQVRAQLAATLQGVVCQTLVKRSSGKGRVVATEVLVGTHAVANLIREGKTYQVNSAMQAGRDLGMHTMDQHLADLVNSGQITFDAAVEKAQDLEVLKRLVTRTESTDMGAMSDGVNYGDRYSSSH